MGSELVCRLRSVAPAHARLARLYSKGVIAKERKWKEKTVRGSERYVFCVFIYSYFEFSFSFLICAL